MLASGSPQIARLCSHRRWNRIAGLAILLAFTQAAAADQVSNSGTQVSVSLANADLPANDLMRPEGEKSRLLSPEEAWELKKSGLDLSRLEPDTTSDIYRPLDSAQAPSEGASNPSGDETIPITSGDTVDFQGVISSSAGRFRFNVQTRDPVQARTLTLLLSKEVHTTLLRKELLRRLGYRVPEMKYLPRIRVGFRDASSRDFFVRTQVPTATFGAASRWCSVAPEVLKQDPTYPCTARKDEIDPLSVTLIDIVATEATPLFYNLALGPPIEAIPGTTNLRPEGPRILRALALVYGLANISESINQVEWHLGRIQNGAYQFAVPDEANFACSLDDALWMERKIRALKREDFVQIVAGARYPEAVARVLVEKLIARRNSIGVSLAANAPAGSSPAAPLAFDPKVSLLPDLKDGKIQREQWPGYASRFAWGDPDSPLKGLQWYVLSEVQSNVMETLLNKANAALPALSIASQTAAHQKKLMQGISDYFNTGMAQSMGIGLWAAPIASGGIELSRNVILGNYLGTNNLVQLVDNFGFNVNIGLMIGVDGLPAILSAQAMAQATASVECTHIKPLKRLKDSVTQPLKNELVPLLMRGAAGVLAATAAYEQSGTLTPDQLKKALADTITHLQAYLGVGESFVLSESLKGLERLGVGVGLNAFAMPGASAEIDANQLLISRLHFFRKDQNTIQVFKDSGQVVGAHFSFEVTLGSPAQFPILSLNAQKITGSAQSRIFTVDVNPDPRLNPNIYASASALASALKTGSVEVLESHQKPTRLWANFTESQHSSQFFHRINRSLKANGKISVRLPDGTSGSFISISGGRQTGAHYQQLATQAATYMVQALSGDTSLGIDTQAAPDPGHSFLGYSRTQSTELQGRVLGDHLSTPMVRMQYRWEGWNIAAENVRSLTDSLSRQYGFKLYPDGFLMDTKVIKLYELDLYVNLYESAFGTLLALTPQQEDALARKVAKQHRCSNIMLPLLRSGEDRAACRYLAKFRGALATYRRGGLTPYNQAINLYNLALDMEQFLDFQDLVKLVGAEHLYVYSTINGFRIGSETISDPIRSNTFGKVDPDNPDGILDSVAKIIGADDGEFKMQWIRGLL